MRCYATCLELVRAGSLSAALLFAALPTCSFGKLACPAAFCTETRLRKKRLQNVVSRTGS